MEKREMLVYALTLAITVVVSMGFIRLLGFLMKTDFPLASVHSWSMDPALHVGDLILVRNQEVSVGDIIVYQKRDQSHIVHRVIRKKSESSGYRVQTQGDANSSPDPEIHSTRITGKVVLVVPYLGIFRLIMEKQPLILVFVFLIFAIASLLSYRSQGST